MDIPFTYARISVTDQCQLECKYCRPVEHRAPLASAQLSAEEITRIAMALANYGVTKIRLTGGEPLLRSDLLPILSRIRNIPGINTIGLTTNGMLLADMAKFLEDSGVQRINISLDSLHAETFRQITGKDALPAVLRGIDAAVRRDRCHVSINVVVMRGINDNELPAFANLTRELPLEVRFIELMPLQNSPFPWQELFVSSQESRAVLGKTETMPMKSSSTARYYRLPHGGIVGFISPVSEPFCASCSRLRVTAGGRLLPCLRLPVGIDLRSMISRPDFDAWLAGVCTQFSKEKLFPLTGKMHPVSAKAMSQIGG